MYKISFHYINTLQNSYPNLGLQMYKEKSWIKEEEIFFSNNVPPSAAKESVTRNNFKFMKPP